MSFRGSTLTQSSGHAQGPESPARIPPVSRLPVCSVDLLLSRLTSQE